MCNPSQYEENVASQLLKDAWWHIVPKRKKKLLIHSLNEGFTNLLTYELTAIWDTDYPLIDGSE